MDYFKGTNWWPAVILALVIGGPLALISYGRHQGWEMHRDCLQEALRAQPEPELPGSHSPLRQALGVGPAPEMSPGEFAESLLQSCQKLP